MTVRNAASMPAESSDWTARGYHGCGNVQPLLGSLTGRTAIICGNGAGVFAQLTEAQSASPDAVVFGVNDVGMYLPTMDHWMSLHADHLLPWTLVRAQAVPTSAPYLVHSATARIGVQHVWDRLTPCFALSGYWAMQLAWIMGAAQIVLCGCPGEASPRFFEAASRTDFAYGGGDDGIKAQLMKEMSRLPAFKAAVRSISGGFTEHYFGRI